MEKGNHNAGAFGSRPLLVESFLSHIPTWSDNADKISAGIWLSIVGE